MRVLLKTATLTQKSARVNAIKGRHRRARVILKNMLSYFEDVWTMQAVPLFTASIANCILFLFDIR